MRVAPDEAAGRIQDAAATLGGAVAAGATERNLVISDQGRMPGDMALSMILGEYLIHGWDLARATGQAWDPDEDTIRTAHAFLAGMVTPEYRGPGGMFGPEVDVPADAPALEKLVGFAGRDPKWAPA